MEVKHSLVLIVDDIQSNVEFLRDILSTLERVEVHGINDGPSALDYIRKRKPDLILLDVSMPEMDGFEVCKKLQSDKQYSDIPIIFLTARVQKEDIVQGFESGAVDYIAKPFNLSELISRVKTHLELSHKRKELQEMNSHLEEMVSERTQQLMNANRELSGANKKLSKMYEELSALDYAKDDFIAHINHELRTPLNGILGHTSILEENANEANKTTIKAINDLVSRLINVSEIALLLTELRSKDHKINIRETVLLESIQRAIPLEPVRRKNISIEIKDITDQHLVLAELQLLSKCFAFILDNAIKYSPVNGQISITGRDNIDYFTVDIEDKGPGFSATSISSLFELFKADNLEHRSHGFGLGLATAKKITDLIGGKIKIRNTKSGAAVMLHLRKP